jgi:hypothetical protein
MQYSGRNGCVRTSAVGISRYALTYSLIVSLVAVSKCSYRHRLNVTSSTLVELMSDRTVLPTSECKQASRIPGSAFIISNIRFENFAANYRIVPYCGGGV